MWPYIKCKELQTLLILRKQNVEIVEICFKKKMTVKRGKIVFGCLFTECVDQFLSLLKLVNYVCVSISFSVCLYYCATSLFAGLNPSKTQCLPSFLSSSLLHFLSFPPLIFLFSSFLPLFLPSSSLPPLCLIAALPCYNAFCHPGSFENNVIQYGGWSFSQKAI